MIERIIDNLWAIIWFIVISFLLFFSDTTIMYSVKDDITTQSYFLHKKDCEKAVSLIENKKAWCGKPWS